jgi:general secretion pathway protein A
MFLQFYGLREQPFGVTPDPRFLYLGSSHREALASLHCGVETGRGFVAMIARPGMGKTTLLVQLLERLRGYSRTAFLFQTQCDSRELLRYLLTDAGLSVQEHDVVALHHQFNQLLAREARSGKRFVVVIDEAQNLDDDALETVRLLSNFETGRAKLLQIILAGQPQLAERLASQRLTQLRQRISIVCRLRPLQGEEIEQYVAHRLQAAGYSGPPLFNREALELIACRSQGIPRNINNLCFNALSLGCALDRTEIGPDLVEEVTADLDIEAILKEEIASAASPELHGDGASASPEPVNGRLQPEMMSASPGNSAEPLVEHLDEPPADGLGNTSGEQIPEHASVPEEVKEWSYEEKQLSPARCPLVAIAVVFTALLLISGAKLEQRHIPGGHHRRVSLLRVGIPPSDSSALVLPGAASHERSLAAAKGSRQ